MSLSQRLRALCTWGIPNTHADYPALLNERLLILEVAFWGVMNGTSLAFLQVFGVRLGAPTMLLGLLVSVPALVGALWTLPAGRILERQRNPMRTMLLAFTLSRFMQALAAFLPFWLPIPPGYTLVLLITLFSFPEGIAIVAFFSLEVSSIPRERIARLEGRRMATAGITTALMTLVSGQILRWIPFPLNYQVLFLVGLLGGWTSVFFLAGIRPGPAFLRSASAPQALPGSNNVAAILTTLREATRSERPFFLLLLGVLGVNLAQALPAPIFPIYWVRNLHASDSWISALGAVNSGANVLAALAMGRLIRRWGNRRILLTCTALSALYPLAHALAPSMASLLPAAILMGIALAGMRVATFNQVMATCPERNRPTYLAAYVSQNYVASFIGPLVGAALVVPVGMVAVLCLAALLRLIAGVFLGRMAR